MHPDGTTGRGSARQEQDEMIPEQQEDCHSALFWMAFVGVATCGNQAEGNGRRGVFGSILRKSLQRLGEEGRLRDVEDMQPCLAGFLWVESICRPVLHGLSAALDSLDVE